MYFSGRFILIESVCLAEIYSDKLETRKAELLEI